VLTINDFHPLIDKNRLYLCQVPNFLEGCFQRFDVTSVLVTIIM